MLRRRARLGECIDQLIEMDGGTCVIRLGREAGAGQGVGGGAYIGDLALGYRLWITRPGDRDQGTARCHGQGDTARTKFFDQPGGQAEAHGGELAGAFNGQARDQRQTPHLTARRFMDERDFCAGPKR